MRDTELEPVIDDLQRLVGLPFGGAWQPARDRIVLGLGRERFLLVVPRGPLARIHSLARRPPNPTKPFSFQGAVRATVRGALVALRKHPDDRIVDLVFEDGVLHLRLTGRGGGLWLMRDGEVRAAYDGPAPDTLPELPALPPRKVPPRFTPAGGERWDEAARRWFTAEERRRAVDQERARIRRALRRQLDRDLRLAEALERDLGSARSAPRLRASADALAATLHTLRKGMAEAAVPDLEDPTVIHRVPLDPAVPPSVSMERLYQRAGRLERVADRATRRLAECAERIAATRTALEEVEEADRARLDQLGALVPAAPAGARATRSLPFDTWHGPGGQVVWVGRNEKGNRVLTFQKARGRDFWLHVRDRPGAHVVIPVRTDHPPPLELLLAAAQIALLQAKVPEGASADVQYTRIKDLRSIPGETAKVIVTEEKVLHVRRDPSALVGWCRE